MRIWVSLLAVAAVGCAVSRSRIAPDALVLPSQQRNWRDTFALCRAQDRHFAQGHDAEMEQEYRENIVKRPQDALGYFFLGRLYGLQGRIQDALRLMQIAIRKDPGCLWPYYNLGVHYLKQRNHFQARAHFSKCLLYVPDFAPAWVGLAGLQNNDVDKAVCYLRRAVAQVPDCGTWHYELALLLIQKGVNKEAEKHLEAARRLTPHSKKILKTLALWYVKRREKKKAVGVLRQFYGEERDAARRGKIRALIQRLNREIVNERP